MVGKSLPRADSVLLLRNAIFAPYLFAVQYDYLLDSAGYNLGSLEGPLTENQIISVAVHHLHKVDDNFEVELGKSDLKVTDAVQRVVDLLHRLYGSRTSKSYGKFETNEVDYPTQANLRHYVDGKADFSAMSEALMKTLQSKAKGKGGATGGHVFFAHFVRDQRHYLLVSIVNDKMSAALTKQNDVQEVTHLDVDGFRFAGRINITGWANKEDRYIGFLRGKGNVAEYFQEFLGCTATFQEKEDTRALVNALNGFAEAQGYSAAVRDHFLTRAREICGKVSSKREELSFDTLAHELTPEDPAVLKEHLANPDLMLNDGFIPHRGILNTLVRFKAKTPNWSVDFGRDAIKAGEVVYDSKAGTLILTNLPHDLKDRLTEEYGDA